MVAIFTRTINDELASLVKQIDAKAGSFKRGKGKKPLRAFVILLTDDPDAAEGKLKALAKKHNIKNVPLTIFDGVAGPPSYKISQDAEVTVLLWRGAVVKVNHAFSKGKLDKKAVSAVVKSTATILKK